MSRAACDRGSATLWVLAGVLLLVAVSGAGTVRGLAVLARHRAESAADLAALAAAGGIGATGDPCADAGRIAAGNGAAPVSCTVHLAADGRSGTVRVEVSCTVWLPVVGGVRVAASAWAGRVGSSGDATPPSGAVGITAGWPRPPHVG